MRFLIFFVNWTSAFDAIELRLDDIIVRLGHVETGLARVHVQLGEQAVHFDRIDSTGSKSGYS